MKTIGLIAGNGRLPHAVAAEARQKGYRVFAVGLEPLADAGLGELVDEIEYISVGKLGKIINTLRKAGVEEAVMAGKVPKTLLYESRIIPDIRAAKLLMSLKDNKDDTIMLALVDELKKEGISLLNTTAFTENIMAHRGVMTRKKPSKRHMKDIDFGFPIAKLIGGMDIGQSIVVKERAVMAVEAIEGTDEAIRRGGKLAGSEAVVIKVAKIGQDLRFDVPAVGMNTISAMVDVKASVLALEAGATIIMGKDDVLKEADAVGIAVVGISAEGVGSR
jgi:DUF1009 family protein